MFAHQLHSSIGQWRNHSFEIEIQEISPSPLFWEDDNQQRSDADKIRNTDVLPHYYSYDRSLQIKIKLAQLQQTII